MPTTSEQHRRSADEFECPCPLCGALARAVQLRELEAQRIEGCPQCTTYQITDGLVRILADDPKAKERARYLPSAARNATHGTGRNILEYCLKLTEENYLGWAADEEGFQQAVRPMMDYLVSEGIDVRGTYRHSFVHIEVVVPNGDRRTLHVEQDILYRSPEEIKNYCRDFDIAAKLAKTPPGERVEIDRSAPHSKMPID